METNEQQLQYDTACGLDEEVSYSLGHANTC